jgi:hypothetical protein
LDEASAHDLAFPERSPARTSDPYADDLDRSAASLHILALRHCEPAADKASNHVTIEPVSEDEQILGGALGVTRSASRCSALRRGVVISLS